MRVGWTEREGGVDNLRIGILFVKIKIPKSHKSAEGEETGGEKIKKRGYYTRLDGYIFVGNVCVETRRKLSQEGVFFSFQFVFVAFFKQKQKSPCLLAKYYDKTRQ